MKQVVIAGAAVLIAAAVAFKSRTPSLGEFGPAPAVDGFAGHPWIAGFIYTSCAGTCPVLSANMARLQRRLPGDVRFLSVTVDPQRDTQAVLAAYARKLGADPSRWRFLRLDKAKTVALSRDGFHLAAVSGASPVHSDKLVLVDAAGVIRGYYDGTDEEALTRLERDASALARR